MANVNSDTAPGPLETPPDTRVLLHSGGLAASNLPCLGALRHRGATDSPQPSGAIARLGALILGAVLLLPGHATAAPSSVNEVVVVFKTHFDIGYTDMATNIVKKYRTTMMDQALKVVDQNRGLPPEQQFVWTVPGWPMKQILDDWPGQTTERKKQVVDAFQQGRFVVHALPFSMHTELLEPEDLVRGMRFSSELCRANGKPLPRDAKMTDVPCHSWILPTLLKHAGVEFLHLGCNPASSSPVVPRLFWWEGPDGSRLLTMYSAAGYGTGVTPPADWPYRTWLALIHTGDNHGPPTPVEVRQALNEAKQRLPGVKVCIGRLSDFADAILAEKAAIPVVRGDMTDTWIYGPMSNPDGAAIARHIRPAITATEMLETELCGWGVPADHRAAVQVAYEKSLLYGEHTWGGSIPWIYGRYLLRFGPEWEQDRAAGKFIRIESSWAEHTAYIENARDLILPALQQDLEDLARAVNVRPDQGRGMAVDPTFASKHPGLSSRAVFPGQIHSGQGRVVVFNPLPWKRNGVVEVAIPGQGLTDLESIDGKETTHVTHRGGRARFLARDIPPLGYRTYTWRGWHDDNSPEWVSSQARPGVSAGAQVLESPFFKAVLDPVHGTVRSLVDKRNGREMVDATAPQGFGQYLYERFDQDQVRAYVKAYVKIDAEWGINELGKPSLLPAAQAPYRAASPGNFSVSYEQTAVAVSAEMHAAAGPGVPHALTTRLTLPLDQPWVELAVTLHDKPADAWPEAGWICLPFKIDEPQFRLGRLGSIVDPAKDIVAGCNFHQFALNGGLTVMGSGRGVGLCALDSPLVSLGEPGCWRYSQNFTPRRARVFINLFNNQWSTNFRLWNSGTWTSRVRLWSVAGSDAEKNLTTPAAEARVPLLAVFAEGSAGTLPPTQAGLSLSRGGVRVTAFGPNPDGLGTVLRLWEESGRSSRCEVRLPAGWDARRARPVDLRGSPTGEPIPVKGHRFTVSLKAFAPASFLLERINP